MRWIERTRTEIAAVGRYVASFRARAWCLAAFFFAFAAGLTAMSAHAQNPPAPLTRFVVLLDAAHGGDDAGASLEGPSGQMEPEKDFTLAFSVRLRSLLVARGIQVVTTRESDVALDPERRAQIANHAAAQACLTLHGSMSGSGVHLFLSSLAPAQPARFTPWKTAQAAWVPRSLVLTGVLNSALMHAGIAATLGRTALTTVDSMTCPAVAVEVAPENASIHGSASSDGDNPAYQARLAEALAAGLLEWRAAVPASPAGPVGKGNLPEPTGEGQQP